MTITSDDIYDLIRQGENISVEMKESVSLIPNGLS